MSHRATVLVVDDNEDALLATSIILEQGGFRAARALDGRQALDLATHLHPDLILLDVILPDISGLEVLQRIRADPQVAHTPVMLFSGLATAPEEQAWGLDAGADGYLTKPIAPAELLARARALVRHAELTEALRRSERRYRDLVETSEDLIWATDAKGRVTFLNQACFKIFGRHPNEMIGRRFLDFVPAEQAERDAAVFAEALQSGADTLAYTSRVFAKDGREVTLTANARIVRNSEGRVVGSTGISRDISELLKSEDAARSQTALLRIAGHAARLGGWALQVPKLILTWSEVTRAIHEVPAGYTPSLKEAFAFFEEADRVEVIRAVDRCLEDGAPFDLERVVITATERRIWVRVIGEAIRDDDGQIIRIQGAYQDISEQRLAREALRASEERFRLLSKATSDAIWDWNLGTHELWWNEGFETLVGFSRAEIEPTVESWYNRIHPDDKDGVIASVQAAIASSGEAWTGEYRFLRKDGSSIHVRTSCHIIRAPGGEPIRMIGGMTDVTERKRVDERLAEQAALLDAAHEAIVVKDLDDRIVFWNAGAEATFGWSAAEAVGRRSGELLQTDQSRSDAAHEALLRCGRWQGELVKQNKQGLEMMVDARWTLLLDPEGRPRSVLEFNADATQRKRMERHLLRAQRMDSLGTLAGGIAHDLNNALTPVLMAIELLKADQCDPAKLETLGMLESSVQRSADMVRQVLSFARRTEGRPSRIDVMVVVHEVQKIVRDTFPKNVAVALRVAEEPLPIRADATQVYQLLINLCVNARDAMPKGGHLTITIANVGIDDIAEGMEPEGRPGPYLVLRVEDSGTGMPPEVVDRIFEPFYTTKESGRGTGLGLATAHSIVQGLGGFIHVDSELGRGTTFKVYIPADTSTGAVEATVVAQPTLQLGHGETILVVDDEPHVRLIAETVLTRFGYRVRLASNGAEAVSQYVLHQGEIDAVLTDMGMPVMDGPALIVALKALNPAVRVVGSSGQDANGPGANAVAAGVTSFIPKPYTAETLLKVLATIFDRAS